jgi:predicted amidohydrolase YtcJ
MDRRTFLKGAVAGTLAGAGGWVFAQARQTADLALFGGPVITMNSAQPTAEALAVKGGRIVAVGTRAEIEQLCDGQTKRVELAGKCVSPGLIDAHSHLIGFGQMEMFFVNLRPPRVHSFESLRGVLAEAAAKTPRGEWIVGRGFGEFDEGRFPRRADLDPAAPDHPVLLIHWTGQYGLANTLALEKANLLRADVRDPYGGKYLRDSRTGLPDGFLLHYPAIYSVHQPSMDPGQQQQATQWGVQQFAREGVTCVHDNFCNPLYAANYVQAERAGNLPLRIRVYPYVRNLEHCRTLVAQVTRYSGRLARLQGIKLAVDGYPLMYKELAQHGQLNIPMHPQDQFEAIVATIHNAGFQVDVHAAGDRGVDLTLDAFRKAAGSDPEVARRRHRIEHFIFRRESSIRRAADLGVPVCTQPLWLVVRGDDFLRRFGRDPVDYMIPSASFLRGGVKLSYGADVPASPSHRPLDSIRSAMVRRTASGAELDRSEGITFLAALQAHTLDAAYAAFDERELGSIEVGKQGDLAVWNADLRTVRTAADVDRLQVVTTYLSGQPTWTAAPA